MDKPYFRKPRQVSPAFPRARTAPPSPLRTTGGRAPETRRSRLRLEKEGKALLHITVPVVRMKPYNRCNYLPPKGRKALRDSLKALFDITLWNEMERHLYSLPAVVRREVDLWCTRHGISPDCAETVLQHYRLMQSAYARHGIPVRRKYDCA